MAYLSPITVSTPVTLTGPNASVQADPTQLLNPNSTAMLIDQFQFPISVVGTSRIAIFAQQIYVNIQVGAVQLTNGFVPLVALCPNYDGVLGRAPINGGQGGELNPDPTNPLTWHLPKPVYVPPNVLTFVNFMRVVNAVDTNGSSAAIYVRTAVKGRSLPSNYPIPGEIYMPWACATVVNTTQTTTLGDTQTWVSNDNELGNPNNSPMMITRFVGYRNPLTSQNSNGNDIEGPGTTTLRMTVSSGKLLVREPTPFFHLFPGDRRFFDIRGILRGGNEVPGGEFVKARIDFTPPDDVFDDFNLTMVGMQGYRVVQTPVGAAQASP